MNHSTKLQGTQNCTQLWAVFSFIRQAITYPYQLRTCDLRAIAPLVVISALTPSALESWVGAEKPGIGEMAGTCQVDRRAPWLLGHVLVLTTCPQVLSLSFLPVKICCGWCWGWLVEHVVHMCSLLAPHPSPHLLSPILIHNPRQGSQEYFGNLKKDKLCNFLKKLRNCRLGDCYVGSIRYQIVRA